MVEPRGRMCATRHPELRVPWIRVQHGFGLLWWGTGLYRRYLYGGARARMPLQLGLHRWLLLFPPGVHVNRVHEPFRLHDRRRFVLQVTTVTVITEATGATVGALKTRSGRIPVRLIFSTERLGTLCHGLSRVPRFACQNLTAPDRRGDRPTARRCAARLTAVSYAA